MKLKAGKLIQKFSGGFSRTLNFFVGFFNCIIGKHEWEIRTIHLTTNFGFKVCTVAWACKHCKAIDLKTPIEKPNADSAKQESMVSVK
jgi:hypothetical protein